MLKDKIEKLLLNVKTPSRYIGGELNSVVKDKNKVDMRFAFCFPDTYEIGMSHLGMKILYSLTNERENFWCERVFAPDVDFEKLMRENDIPLYGLESLEPIKDFDFIGFTIQYEMCYTNILNMLDLAGFNYSADGFMLPNLMYIDDLKVHSESCSDISITLDAIISAAKLHPNTAGTSKVLIACYTESENVRRIMRDRCFMTVGNSNLMLLIVDTDRIAISGYKPCEPPAFM